MQVTVLAGLTLYPRERERERERERFYEPKPFLFRFAIIFEYMLYVPTSDSSNQNICIYCSHRLKPVRTGYILYTTAVIKPIGIHIWGKKVYLNITFVLCRCEVQIICTLRLFYDVTKYKLIVHCDCFLTLRSTNYLYITIALRCYN